MQNPTVKRIVLWSISLGLTLVSSCTIDSLPIEPTGSATGGAGGAGTGGMVNDLDENDTLDADTGMCEVHSDCGADQICNTKINMCVTALSGNCDTVLSGVGVGQGSLDDITDNTRIIGAITPRTFQEGAFGYIEIAIDLAISEANSSSLPDNRKLAVIACDSRPQDGDEPTCNEDSNFAGCDWVNQANHLVNTVGVPAIVGPAFSGVFTQVHEITGPAGVVTISGSATSPAISNLDEIAGHDPGMAWRVIPSDAQQAQAIAALVQLRNVQRVLVLVKGDSYGNGLLEVFQTRFTTQISSGDFVIATFDASASQAQILEAATSNCTADADLDAVVMLTTAEGGALMEACEDTLANFSVLPEDRPRYILSEGVKDGTVDVLSTMNFSDADITNLLTRIEGTQPIVRNADDSIYIPFRTRFENYDPNGNQPGLFASTFYDATHTLYASLCTIPTDQPFSGQAIATGFTSVNSGSAYTPALRNDRETACLSLNNGGMVDYVGVSGLVEFDLATGDINATTFTRWTIEATGGDVSALSFNDASGLYTVATDQWDIQ